MGILLWVLGLGIWGSSYIIPKAIFHLLKGDYTWKAIWTGRLFKWVPVSLGDIDKGPHQILFVG